MEKECSNRQLACFRNVNQGGNDCGLCAVILPVLLKTGILLHVLEENPAAMLKEPRKRMTLTFSRKHFLLPSPIKMWH